jgi:hypothetical protein
MKCEEVGEKLHNEELHNFAKYNENDQVKVHIMCRSFSTSGEEEKRIEFIDRRARKKWEDRKTKT